MADIENILDKMEDVEENINEMLHPEEEEYFEDKHSSPRKRNKFIRFLSFIGALPKGLQIGLLVTVSIILLSGIGFGGYKLGWFDRTPLVIDKTNNIVLEIKRIGQYTTTCIVEELVLHEVRIDTNQVAGINIYKKNEVVLIGKGRVNAGFDLSKLTTDDIRKHRDTIFLQLPKPEVFEIIMNPSDFETFHEKGLWSHELTKPLKAQARQKLLDDAERFRILEKAESYGIQRLTELMNGLGYSNVVITINYGEVEDKTALM